MGDMARISVFFPSQTTAAYFVSLALLLLALPSQAQVALKPISTEYTRAQAIDWVDDSTFAVGRWDGSLALFRVPVGGEFTPVLLQVRASVGGAAVEMVAALDNRTIIFSEGPAAVGLWVKGKGQVFDRYYRFSYDTSLGIANSATTVHASEVDLVITGHANGFAEVWERRGDSLTSLRTIDLRSPKPLSSPYPLKNIRGLVSWSNGIVLSGSEDGDIVAFAPAHGRILYRQRYNPSAQRGINGISILGDYLILANCSVGPADKNLWLYKITKTELKLLDAINLVVDSSLPQSFNFDVDLYDRARVPRFFSSTQEGLLWAGQIATNKIIIDGIGKVASSGGAILDVNKRGTFLAAAAHQLFLFKSD
jgi:hypothetical protein